MKRMKTFLIYALLIAVLWIFSDIVIYLTVKGTYRTLDTTVYLSSPEVTVTESKATYVNGYVKGSIKNITEETINNKFLKIDVYSERDNNLGAKYIRIDNLKPNEVREFNMGYKLTDADYVIVTIEDTVKNVTIDQFKSQEMNFVLIVGTLMFLYLI